MNVQKNHDLADYRPKPDVETLNNGETFKIETVVKSTKLISTKRNNVLKSILGTTKQDTNTR